MRRKFFIAFLALFLCILSFLSYFITPVFENHSQNKGLPWEEYDPSYFYKFQSIQDIITEADRQFQSKSKFTIDYYNYVAEIIRKRFYHGYSHYTMATNPLAFLAGKLFWSHLSAIVIPDDIMKHPMAACSQQGIVLMEIFKRQGIDFRKVGFTGHFAVEGKIEGEWKYFDTNLEPNFNNRRESLQELLATNRFDSAYSNVKINAVTFHKEVSHPTYGKVNESPAPNATIFHKACYLLQSKFFLISVLSVTLINVIGFTHIRRISLGYKEKLAVLFQRS